MALISQAMSADHKGNASICQACCTSIEVLCAGPSADERQRRAGDEGAIAALVGAMRTHPTLLPHARAALGNLLRGQPELRQRAVDAGAQVEWLGDA